MKIPRYGFTSGSEEQFLRVTTSEQMEGVWDLRPTELTLLSASKNGVAYHANYTKRFNASPSPSSPYAYDQVYALKAAIEAAGTVDNTEAVAKALRNLPVPPQVVMQYQPVDGKMFDSNGQALHLQRCLPVAEGPVGVRGGPAVGLEGLFAVPEHPELTKRSGRC